MGNVQSEATQESESAKDGEEKAHPDRSKSERESSGIKHDPGSRSPGPQAPERKAVSQTLSSEPGGGDRPTGPAEMGKNHSKKSRLKLSSMWAQNSASSGMKEASLCDKDLGAEKWGLACLSRADLQSGQGLQEEPKGLKMALRSSPAATAHPDPRDLSAKKAPSKGKGKPENAHLAKGAGGMPLPPGKMAEVSQAGDTPKVVVETQVCWTQHIKTSSKEGLDDEDWQPEPLPSVKKQAGGSTHGTEALKASEDPLGGPGSRSLNEKNMCRPAPSGCIAPPGVKKVPLSWGAGQREKEQTGQPDNAPGSDGDFRGPAGAAQLSVDWANACNGPPEKLQAAGSHAKAGAKSEAPGPEAVNSETMQELLEKGLNFLYKVTIQPGQWPPSIKAVKQKSSIISSGISYADVLKQCPQKKSPASAPVLPKALQHLSSAGKKLPSFKGLDRSNSDEFSSLSQLFLEHLKKVAPKEPAPSTPTQQVVTFFEELSTSNPKQAEWQRPRPPTPYPQRRKGQGRKLPKFGTAVSQVVAFLGSDPKCDWFVRDESEMLLDEAAGAGEEGADDCADPPGVGVRGADAGGASQTVTTLLLEQAMVAEIDGSPQRSCRKLQGLEEGAKERSPAKCAPSSAAQHIVSPLAEDPATVQFLGPGQPSPQETPEVPPSPSISAPACASVGPGADPKGPALTQTRPKIRKQSLATPKSKEKLKPSGQPKVKASKGKGTKPWPRAYGMNSQLRLDGVPLFPPFEKVARPFYFGEPLPSAEEDPEADRSHARHWPAFQVADSCPRTCYCKHQDQRKLPKNVVAW
ncbi:gametogenetin isoform 1-T1 [Liasis olivaceus]